MNVIQDPRTRILIGMWVVMVRLVGFYLKKRNLLELNTGHVCHALTEDLPKCVLCIETMQEAEFKDRT